MIRRFPPQSIPLYGVEVNGRRSNFTFTSRPAADQHAVLVGGVVVTIVVPARSVDPVPVQALAQITEVGIEFDAHGATTVTIAAVEVTDD